MKITTRISGSAVVVDLAGRLTADDGVKVIYTQVNKLIAGGSRNIILNLAGLQMMDSSGLGELVRVNQTLGGKLALLKVRAQEKRVFDLANLSSKFRFFISETEALKAFG